MSTLSLNKDDLRTRDRNQSALNRDSIVDSMHEAGNFETNSDKNINEIESDIPVKTKDR